MYILFETLVNVDNRGLTRRAPPMPKLATFLASLLSVLPFILHFFKFYLSSESSFIYTIDEWYPLKQSKI